MIDNTTLFLTPKNKQKETFAKWLNKLKRTASLFKIISSTEYNPSPKLMSRRDRIRAGLQKRNQTNDSYFKSI